MTLLKFEALGLGSPLARAALARGLETPTSIQTAAIPKILDGEDVIGLAQTGTGKTAAFTLPLLQNLADDLEDAEDAPRGPRALILAPTRELAVQINDTVRSVAGAVGVASVVIVGGVSRGPQEKALAAKPHVVVGTPGRILDLINTRHLRLHAVSDFILDEADQMLDLGFIPDVRRIARGLSKERQTAMFSATWPKHVAALAEELLDNPVRVVAGERKERPAPPSAIDQLIHFVQTNGERLDALRAVFEDQDVASAIVFTRTKRGANRVSAVLEKIGVEAAPIHGNKSQNARQAALNRFKSGELRALVATDIAARGLDIKDVSHVVNFDMPVTAEAYVHRIGRTARAGATGAALSFCGPEELDLLKAIEKLLGKPVPKRGERPAAVAPASMARPGGKPATKARGGKAPMANTHPNARRAERRPSKPRSNAPSRSSSRGRSKRVAEHT